MEGDTRVRAMEIKTNLVTGDFEAAAALLEMLSKFVAEHHGATTLTMSAHEVETPEGHSTQAPADDVPPMDDPDRPLDGPWGVAAEEDG